MSRLTDLLRQVRGSDAQLGADLEKEVAALTKRRSFGLVFERHKPEAVELPHQPVRRGAKVYVLPPRGEIKKGDQRLWRVESLDSDGFGTRTAQLIELTREDPERATVVVEDLVVVAEFEDKIYPGLVETGRVERGGDKPFHTVINAENYHALEMLTYTHRGKVDAIYIDPPYNTGARDWKYNNDYVEGDDDYRHSKWLAFMERRLLVARELLNPENSVLIVTIDEKEYLRLGMLLEQTFPEARVQMITSIINPAGSPRSGGYSRTEEYVYFVMLGEAAPARGEFDMSGDEKQRVATPDMWSRLQRGGTGARREDSKNLFYPIFVDRTAHKIRKIGNPLPLGVDRSTVQGEPGDFIIWPIRSDGTEGRWRVSHTSLQQLLGLGYVRLGKDGTSVSYLLRSAVKRLEDGELEVVDRTSDGAVVLKASDTAQRAVPAKSVWNRKSHDASTGGSYLLRGLLPERKFPFPKSLFAVEDTLGFFVGDKPNAVILDFFSGSGTTAHAAMRLNKIDGGSRQCISVTNNEVSAEEQVKFKKAKLRPGDCEWEQRGICDYITKPRIRSAIIGRTPDGDLVKGEYKFNDMFPLSEGLEENAAFFTLTYETPLSVRHNRAFERVAPILWLRAGAVGRIIDNLDGRGWDVSDVYAVLENLDDADQFFEKTRSCSSVRTVFVITDDDAAFQMVCRELPTDLNVVRLYESYLQNFELNQGRSL